METCAGIPGWPDPIGRPVCTAHTIDPSLFTDFPRSKRDDAFHQRSAGEASEGGQLKPTDIVERSITMKKLAALLTTIGLVTVAPLAGASEDGLDLMPKARAVEATQYVRDQGPSGATSSDADSFYSRGTGGISPQ
jgi:hypothetical protein